MKTAYLKTYSWESLQCELGEGEGREGGEGREERGGGRGEGKKDNRIKQKDVLIVSLQRNKYQVDTILFFYNFKTSQDCASIL